MDIWLIKDGEHLPVQGDSRKMRTWMLAEALVARGHRVIWWHSTFSHQRKTLLYDHDVELELGPQFYLKLLYAGEYKMNVSMRRYLQHRVLGRRFREAAYRMPPPDAIVCSFPTIDLAYYAVAYSKKCECPIIVDIRDLWPDTFLEKIPRPLRRVARVVLDGDFRRTRYVCSSADSLVAISQGCLNWALRYAGRAQSSHDRVFHTGYPDDRLSSEQDQLSLPEFLVPVKAKVIFSYVGSFGASYNLRSLCEVARMCQERGMYNVHFVLAGDGDQYQDIARRAGGLSNLSLTGWLPHSEVRRLLAHSNVGLVPLRSVRDALPNKPYEYFSAGLPILSSLEGELEGIIDEYKVGYSYKDGDVAALFNLIAKLTNDSDGRATFARNARALFESKFTWSFIYGAYARHVEWVAEHVKGRLRGPLSGRVLTHDAHMQPSGDSGQEGSHRLRNCM